ncbi:IS3 family transposase [Chloroflexi bacterium TSY]|nr:IS3 family transposase [Chloroflexi bacterium TSY]
MKTLCDLLECPRSTYYYEPRDKDEAELIAAMEEIMMRWPRYGYRRILAQLKREEKIAGERVVRRLLKLLGGSCQVGRVRIRTTNSDHEHRRYPNRIKRICQILCVNERKIKAFPKKKWTKRAKVATASRDRTRRPSQLLGCTREGSGPQSEWQAGCGSGPSWEGAWSTFWRCCDGPKREACVQIWESEKRTYSW